MNNLIQKQNRFINKVYDSKLNLKPLKIDTLQVNITKLCNQACRHCHVDSSPSRTEQMSKLTVDQCLKVLEQNPDISKLDITGGAPELNPHFDYMVESARRLGKHVMVRHNLTVIFDGNPQTKESKEYLPEFFSKHQVEIISSLPYYQEFFTDKQRGRGVFNKSIEGLKRLNSVGYGTDGTGKVLNLVYNPVGPYLPADQRTLEADYKKELMGKFGISFNHLFAITNMPIHRFKEDLERNGNLDDYMTKLINAFNPNAAEGIMCRSLVSVSYDGKLYDCDFNQMLQLDLTDPSCNSIFHFDVKKLTERTIIFDDHCFGCTAGAGSSCGGNTA
ncbi:MAG: radical SAM/Cys-rich domain protein [Deltaproteobacteria bacterium]|nr:radical SAM/Cys-rich domain protein [Deltaproteobacteria bacterium]